MVSCRNKIPQAFWGTSKTTPHSEAIYRSTNDETDFSVRFLSLAPKKVSEGGFVALEWPRKIPDRVVAYDLSAKTTLRRKEVAGRTRLHSGPLFLKRFRPGYPHRDPLAAIRKRRESFDNELIDRPVPRSNRADHADRFTTYDCAVALRILELVVVQNRNRRLQVPKSDAYLYLLSKLLRRPELLSQSV